MADRCVIVAPYWGHPNHVGVYRVDRFVRWLAAAGVTVTVVRAGVADFATPRPWGMDVTIRDPFNFYPEATPGPSATPAVPPAPPPPPRRPNRLRRFVAYSLFNPDPTVIWARRAAAHPLVLEHAAAARWVLASSPPESAHVGAERLAHRLGAELLVDMRDGWLDDPLKPTLRASRLQRWREGRTERRVLRAASRVFVTSSVWRRMLLERRPELAGRIAVLTNAYPARMPQMGPPPAAPPAGTLTLLHAGQFSLSRGTQRVGALLAPLVASPRFAASAPGRVVLLGKLGDADLAEAEGWRRRLGEAGWTLETPGEVPRDEALARLGSAHGLLLLCASDAAIPSKAFEYLCVRRPILTVTGPAGALWEACAGVPQVFLVDSALPDPSRVDAFLRAAAEGMDDGAFERPAKFGEAALSRIFLDALGLGEGRPLQPAATEG